MKQVFLLLCLANVLFFFWKLHFGASTPANQVQAALPSIVLVAERDAALRSVAISRVLDRDAAELQRLTAPAAFAAPKPKQLAGAAVKSEKKSLPAATGKPEPVRVICYEAGPFSDDRELQRWLRGKPLLFTKPFVRETTVSADYQLYLPPAKDAEQARLNKLTLHAKGIDDVWMVPDGEIKGALSLGVFVDRARALAFKEQLAARGVRAELRQRSKTRQALFLHFGAAAAFPGSGGYQRIPAADCK
ncbi:hypothetical protein ACH518_17380 [Methylomonas sp. HW2-6]|uniref:hypothetical protein n=1 Tax=Methylomonas sp. HW2-6 TaxID=3376687 RepID=UPI00404223A9